MKYKKFIVTAVIIAVISLLFLFTTINKGSVVITLQEDPSSLTTASFDANNGEPPIRYIIESKSTKVSIKPGSYFVLIENNTGSYAKFIEVSGFLNTAKIENFTLTTQLGREFVAERPKSCFSETSLGIFSYLCLGPLSSLVLHEKATNSTPPKTIAVSNGIVSGDRVIEAVHETEGDVYVLAYAPERESLRDVYKINKAQGNLTLNLIDAVSLASQPLKQQDVTYSKSTVTLINSSVVYGGDNLRRLQRLISPVDFGTDIVSIGQFEGGTWVTLEEQFVSSDPPITNYLVRIVDDDKSVRTEKPSDFVVCSNHLFILDNEGQLSVFNSELELRQSLSKVSDFTCANNKPHITRENALFVFSLQESEFVGFVAFRSPTMQINNVESYEKSIFVVSNFSYKKVLLKISESADKTDVLLDELISSQYVSSVSVGGSTIFVSLELGERVVNPITGEFNYDENIVASAEKEVRQIIDDIKSANPDLEFIVPLID